METEEAGALGSAVLAGSATGVFSSPMEAVGHMTRTGGRFEPCPNRVSFYEDRYGQYSRLWPMLKDYLREIDGFIKA